MKWIVIEMLDPENPQILLEEEEPFMGNYEEALLYAANEAHFPIVVPLSHTLGQDMQEAQNFISVTKFELGEEYDEGNVEEVIGKYFVEDE